MEKREYKIIKIDGDYATLQRTDVSDKDTILVALALLPFGSDIGTELIWENFSYELK
jgi:hypothetical protein